MEEFRPIPGYEGLYEVSNLGRIKSLERVRQNDGKYHCVIKERIRKTRINRCGYEYVICKNNGVRKSLTIHRLVGQAFILNPENKPCINHKNGVKSDNIVENLERCTVSENMKHKFQILGVKGNAPNRGKKGHIFTYNKEVGQYGIDGLLIKTYCSINEAERKTNIQGICNVCMGKRKKAGGYIRKHLTTA